MATRGRPPRIPREQQEQELLAAARRVIDAHGIDDAQVGDIARAAGISKALVYRHFASKDELRIAAVVVYLDELGELLESSAGAADPIDELLDVAACFIRYGIDHPAFLDCSLAVLRRPPQELLDQLSPATLLRVTQAMARSLRIIVAVIDRGRQTGAFTIEDPHLWANYWYARALGALHLARIGAIVCPSEAEVPGLRSVAADEIERIALHDLLADVGVTDPAAALDARRARSASTPSSA
jgi:AcrR family transcriptional regulator